MFNTGGIVLRSSPLTSGRDIKVITHLTNQSAPPGRDAKDILKERVAFSALSDSEDRFDPPRCHPDTRIVVLDTINAWAQNDTGDSKPVFWLRGAAGAGKSAIAQTCAEKWAPIGILLASFFFSRTIQERNNSACFVATLAYQISLAIPETWPHIEKALLKDIGLFKKSLRTQMSELVMYPLKAAASGTSQRRVIILVDGLDECCMAIGLRDHETQQREILEVIADVAQSDNPRLYFFIASRPERQIRSSFSDEPLSSFSHALDLSTANSSSEDIELFVRCSFDRIRAQRRHISSEWPPETTIKLLVEKSSGHFIYASTAMKHIGRPRAEPQASLETILNASRARNTQENPFATLDELYMLILRNVAPESISIVLQIFEILFFDDFSFRDYRCFSSAVNLSLFYIDRHLFLPPGSSDLHLMDLHSIISIPSDGDRTNTPIRFAHASSGEFLLNPSRSQSFFVDEAQAMEEIQLRRLKHLYLQVTLADGGESLGYRPTGFISCFAEQINAHKVSGAITEGILALIDNSYRFSQYVARVHSTYMQRFRNRTLLLHMWGLCGYDLTNYLLKCKIKNAGELCSWENIERMLGTSFDVDETETGLTYTSRGSEIADTPPEPGTSSNTSPESGLNLIGSYVKQENRVTGVEKERKGLRRKLFMLRQNVSHWREPHRRPD